MTVATSDYGISTDVNRPYEQAVEAIREALAQEGFGVLTEIDIRETLNAALRPWPCSRRPPSAGLV